MSDRWIFSLGLALMFVLGARPAALDLARGGEKSAPRAVARIAGSPRAVTG